MDQKKVDQENETASEQSQKKGSLVESISMPKEIPRSRGKNKFFREDGSFNEDRFYSLLGNDIRRKILSKLSKFPRYASDLSVDLNVSKQAIKKHLDKLEDFGLVEKAELNDDQKKQYYQINSDVALFAQIDLTPNYFSLNIHNSPEEMVQRFQEHMTHNPETSITTSTRARRDYSHLNFALKSLGQQLNTVEKKIDRIERERRKILLEKTVLLNRIQMIINSLVENDQEKEVIFSLFFDTKATVEGLSLEDILNQLFLRKKKRAGISKYKMLKTDPKTIERGQQLLKLLQMLINNFGFIRTDESKLFFDFGEQ